MALDLDAYLERYAPKPDDSGDWRKQAMAAGFALMGSRKGYELEGLGRAGLLAMDVGENMKKTRREEHRQRLADVSAMWKLAKDEQDREQRNNMISTVMSGLTGGSPSGMPAGAPPGGGGGFMPASMPAQQGGPIPPAGGASLPPFPGPQSPMPMPGRGGPPGISPAAFALSTMPGLGDTAKIVQGAADKAAEWGALQVGPNGVLYDKSGPRGMLAPEGRGYMLDGKWTPGSPELIAAVRAGKVEDVQFAIQKAEAEARARAQHTPFQVPGTNTVTSAANAVGGGVSGPAPAMVTAAEEAAKHGAKQEADFNASAQQAAGYADAVRTLRMTDPGKYYSGGMSDFRMDMDNLFSVIPGLAEYVDKEKLGTAQAFSSRYKQVILEKVSPMLKGQTSDRDVRIMLTSGPGLFMQPEGRELLYEIVEENAARAQRIAEAASAHMAKHGNMRGFNARTASGEYKPLLSIKARQLGATEQARLRDMAERQARGELDKAALAEAVKAGWLLY
jgi:hypothetical protein